MRRRIGIYRGSEEALRLIGLLVSNPEIDVVRVYDPSPESVLERARSFGPELEDFLLLVLTSDLDSFKDGSDLDAVVDAGPDGELASVLSESARQGLQIVTPLSARLLWAYGVAARDRKAELLQALGEVVDSVELTIDSEELFTRMLEIAIGVTGAEGGSLMLLDSGSRELWIRVAVGIERELWPKIRVPLGEGLAGRAAADGRALRVAGKADHSRFRIVRERLDVESALCVPLLHHGRVLGVLNLHHTTQQGTFGPEDLEFVEQLAQLDAQIIARAQEHESLRDQAARYSAVREVQSVLARPEPLADRLRALCLDIAERAKDGIVNLYLREGDEPDLRLAATSLEGGGFGGEYRVVLGQGIDGRVGASGKPCFLRGEQGQIEYASLPLSVPGLEPIGVLSVQAGRPGMVERADQEMLLEVASALGKALAQSEREGRISARANRLSAINETGIRMLSATGLTEVVRLATSSASMILDAEHAVLRLQDATSKRFVIRSYFGPADGPQQERLFRLDKQVSLRALQERRAFALRDLRRDPELAAVGAGCQSVLAAPLKRDGVAIGTLTVYDKMPGDRFYPAAFDDDDLQVFAKFVSYVERAVLGAQERSLSREHSHVDLETGVPNASYLEQRMREEITRAAEREGTLVLATCSIENHAEIQREVGSAHAGRVVQRVADALQQNTRDFDVVGRVADDLFEVLIPEPGDEPGDRIYTLARAVADAVSKDETLNRPVRVALGFGYAVHPGDGADPDSLAAAARPPRIRMV